MAHRIQLVPAAKLSDLPPTEHLGSTKLISRGFNVIFGASGAFKSFYALDASLQVAQTQPVIYVAAEGAGGLARRVDAWCAYNNSSPGQLFFVCQEVNLLDPAQVKSLIATSLPVKPVMTVFDTLARCIPGGDENSAKDMGIAVKNSSIIQRDVGCAITWLHHTNRAERGERGSGAIRGAADAMIELSANGDGVIRVACSKLKDEEPWVTEERRFFSVGASGVLVGNTTFSTALSALALQVLEFLTLGVFDTSGAKTTQIVNALNINERSVYRILSHLKNEGCISQDIKGDPFKLTPKGAALVCKTTGKTPTAKVINLVPTPVDPEIDVDFPIAAGL